MNAIEYVLGDFWHFVGAVILLGVLLNGIVEIITAVRGCP